MVIALDVGTSSARASLYDLTGRAVPGRFHQVPLAPAVTPDGGVEHDPARTQIMADAFGRPIRWSPEPEATSRGAALLALDALRVLPDLSASPGELGETFPPDPGRHARYREALERQRRLDDRV